MSPSCWGARSVSRRRCARLPRNDFPSRASPFRTSSRDWCWPSSCIARGRSCAASRITSERRDLPERVEGSVSEPRVVTLPFGGSALTRAALAGSMPAEWSEHAPAGAEQWGARSRAVMSDAGARAWASALAPALGANGAAADRLARSAEGRGVVVTTGQQPGLFGGPVYTWSKAISALTLADAIEGATGIPTAPVFWAATYDADFAESSASYVILNGDLVRLQQPLPEVTDRSMRDTPLGDIAPLLRLLELASGSAVGRAATEAVRAAYQPGQTI